MQNGNIQFNPNPQTNPTAIGNNWHHLTTNSEERKNTSHSIDNEEKFNNLVEGTSQFSYKIRTHAPIDFFPNELIIDINKVSVLYKTFMSRDVLSIPIKDINKVEVTNDILSASIEIVNGSQTTTLTLTWLKKREAREVQAIIQGLLVAAKNDIDISQFDSSEITERLKMLGSPKI
jgi:hypothetical protein